MHCGSADGRSGPAVLAACAARRWLARSAAVVRLLRSRTKAAAAACTSLVSCLPALEDVLLHLHGPVVPNELGCLLEALAWCPHLRALDLDMSYRVGGTSEKYEEEDLPWAFPAPALAKLSSLTSLELGFHDSDQYILANVVGALVVLPGLVMLYICFPTYGGMHLVPAALGQLKALRWLMFYSIRTCVLEAGCLDLPQLESLDFYNCEFPDAKVLPCVRALQCLTGIAFDGCQGPLTVDPQLAQLPGLQRLVLLQDTDSGLYLPGPLRLPADMGSLSATLLHLDIAGHMGTRFPQALTQLVALEHLNAKDSEFAELPAGITALSRLTKLKLGRVWDEDPLQLLEKRPLDVRAMGDLSHFPRLCKLTFKFCEVMLCPSVLGAAHHASLNILCFCFAHPAPECAPAVLLLSQKLWRLGWGSVLRAECIDTDLHDELQDAQGRAPCQKFMADLEASRLEACGL